MPPSLQTGPNENYLRRTAAQKAERELMINTLGSRNPINKARSNNAERIARSLAQPFPTRPTRSTSTSSLSRRPAAAPLTRVPSAPTLLTPSTNKSILRKTGNAFVGATEATVNGLGTAAKVTGNALGTATRATVNGLGTAAKVTGQFVRNKLNPLQWFGGKTRRNRRAHKKTRSRRYL